MWNGKENDRKDFKTEWENTEASIQRKQQVPTSTEQSSTSSKMKTPTSPNTESFGLFPSKKSFPETASFSGQSSMVIRFPGKRELRPGSAVYNCIRVAARQLLATRDGDPATVGRIQENWPELLGGTGEKYCRRLLSTGNTVQCCAVRGSAVQCTAV